MMSIYRIIRQIEEDMDKEDIYYMAVNDEREHHLRMAIHGIKSKYEMTQEKHYTL